ncbi:MAG TPA: YdcF family protein [Pyrinomonadaceae bacterium]|nr:YdcF family protein [Pyrinomonadaceae bacterium]
MRRLLKWVLVFIVVWGILAWVAARALIVSAPLDSADAIVVLSGSSTYVERTHKAAELYRQRRAPLVLLTDDHTQGGWSSAVQRNPYFVERATDELIKQGVPVEKIRIIPGMPSGTHDEVLVIKDYASAQRLRSLLVVTSAYHSRRALRRLRQAFAGTETVVGLDPVPPGSQTPSPAFWWMQVEGWRIVGGELVKLVYYRLKYG